MKEKIGAGEHARAIGKRDLEIWVVNVGFALMYSIKVKEQTMLFCRSKARSA